MIFKDQIFTFIATKKPVTSQNQRNRTDERMKDKRKFCRTLWESMDLKKFKNLQTEKDWEIKYHFQMSRLNFIVIQKVVEKYLTVRIDGIITCLFQIKRNKLTADEGKLL